MRRIYFLVPDTTIAKAIVDELLLARFKEKQIHVVARKDTPLDNLPEAHLAQRSDLIPALERGVAAGGLSGLLAGTVAVTFPPAGLVVGGGALLGLTLFGAGFGAWVSTMIGVHLPSRRLQQFEAAIGSGQILMMIDVPRDEVESTQEMIMRRHPEAELEGLEPSLPAFP